MAYNPINPNGQAASANSAPVVIASDQSSIAVTSSLPTGAASSANQTNGTQQTKITDGTNLANVLASGTANSTGNALLTGNTGLSVTFSTTSVQAVASTDAGNYSHVKVQISSQGTNSTVTFQTSNDNTNWVTNTFLPAGNTGNTNGQGSSTTTGIWQGDIQGRYLRLNVTGISAGTTAGTIWFSTAAHAPSMVSASIGTNPILTSESPSTSGGLSYATGSIGNTATSIKSSAGQVYGWYIFNNNNAQSYVQFFNTASGSVSVGSTAPVYSLGIPANAGANAFIPQGITHSTAISIAITTTRAGGTSPTNTVDFNVFYE